MSRRRLLVSRRAWLTGAAGAILGVIGGRYHWRRLRRPQASDLAAFLRRRLAHLDLDSAAVDEFAAEYARRFGALVMAKHHEQTYGGLLGPAALRRLWPAQARSVEAFERHAISYFLRSTTYFREPRRTPIQFVAFADPYEGPCSNPFARLGLE